MNAYSNDSSRIIYSRLQGMLENLIKETGDYLNSFRPSLFFITQEVHTANFPQVKLQSSGTPPSNRFRSLFENGVISFKSESAENYSRNLTALALEIRALLSEDLNSLSQNEETRKLLNKTQKDSRHMISDLQAVTEIIDTNKNLESLDLFRRLMKEEIQHMNWKIMKLQNFFLGLKERVILASVDISKYLKSNPENKRAELFRDFNYNSTYLGSINFLQINLITIDNLLQQINNLSESGNFKEAKWLEVFSELKRTIIECELFFSESEGRCVLPVLYVYEQLRLELEVLNANLSYFEPLVLQVNQNVLQSLNVMYFNEFVLDDIDSRVKGMMDTLDQSKKTLILTTLEDDTLDDFIRLGQAYLTRLKRSKARIKENKDNFCYPYFRPLFNSLVISILRSLKKSSVEVNIFISLVHYLKNLKEIELQFNEVSAEATKYLMKNESMLRNSKVTKQESANDKFHKEFFYALSGFMTQVSQLKENIKRCINVEDFASFGRIRDALISKHDNFLLKMESYLTQIITLLQEGNKQMDIAFSTSLEGGEALLKNMELYLENECDTDWARRLDDKYELEAVQIMQHLKNLYSLRSEFQNFQLEEKLSSVHLKQGFSEKLKALGTMILNYEGLFNTLDSRNYFNNQTILFLLSASSNVDLVHTDYQKFEDVLNNIKIHTKELNDLLTANVFSLNIKTKKFIQERVNIQQEFLKIFTMVSACNRKVLQLKAGLADTDITLFDNLFVNNIVTVTQVYQEVTLIGNLIKELELEYICGEETVTLQQQILSILKEWEKNIHRYVKLDANTAKTLETQLLLINKIKTQYNLKLKTLNELFLLKQSKNEILTKNEKIDRFNLLVAQFQDLIEDSKFAKVYISNYKGFTIHNSDEFYELLAEMNETEKIISQAKKEIKDILAHESEMIQNGGNNSNMTVIIKSYVKQKMEDFQARLLEDKIKTRDIVIKLKKFIEAIFAF